jgi:hypothetical protein
MLTCLIAAVFSEPVWEGAKGYLESLVDRWSTQTEDPARDSVKSGAADAATR